MAEVKLTGRTSDRPIPNPLFSWCTAEAVCGQPIQPDIIDNEDGTTSAQLYVMTFAYLAGCRQTDGQDSPAIGLYDGRFLANER